MTLRPGDVLGRYQVLCPIGAGGMAEVYAARIVGAEQFAKLVALKVMLPHLSRDPKFARMFVDEARLAGNIESAHVVTTLDLGRDEHEGLYQVMELVLGLSLRQLLDASDAPLPRGPALTILAELARGLADAHAARGTDGTPLGLVHRDVSPHNVLIGLDGRTRLSDFGVARAAASVSATESGELKGKLAYAAPEQLKGEVADARSDVFALGVVCWEVLAGRRLFDADNPLALVDMMMTRPIPRLDEVRPELGAPIADLCASMLVRERDGRAITASEAAERLEQLARAAQGSAARDVIGALVRDRAGAALGELEKTVRARAQELSQRASAASPTDRRPAPSTLSRTLGVSVVVLLLLVLGMTVWRGPGEPATRTEPPDDTADPAAPRSPREQVHTAELPPDGPPARAPGDEPAEGARRDTSSVSAESTPERDIARPPPPDEDRGTAPERHAGRATRLREDAAVRGARSASSAGSPPPPTTEPSTPTPPPRTDGASELLGVEDFDRGTEHAP